MTTSTTNVDAPKPELAPSRARSAWPNALTIFRMLMGPSCAALVLLAGSVLYSDRLLAGFLSAVGLYGMLSYTVAKRRSEIGIRMALGADRATVMRLVLHQAGWLLAVGTTAGILMTLAAGRMAGSLLYGLEPSDPLTLVTAVAALGLVGLVSSYLPARYASRLDPLTALRQE